MIKVFTTDQNSRLAGVDLTRQFEEWKACFEPNTIEIGDVHTTSNNYGWMLTVKYTILK